MTPVSAPEPTCANAAQAHPRSASVAGMIFGMSTAVRLASTRIEKQFDQNRINSNRTGGAGIRVVPGMGRHRDGLPLRREGLVRKRVGCRPLHDVEAEVHRAVAVVARLREGVIPVLERLPVLLH